MVILILGYVEFHRGTKSSSKDFHPPNLKHNRVPLEFSRSIDFSILLNSPIISRILLRRLCGTDAPDTGFVSPVLREKYNFSLST